MAKILFVVPPLTGHINPTRGVGAALLAAGHQVGWCGHGDAVRDLPDGAEFFALGADTSGIAAEVLEESKTLRGLRSVKFFFEKFLVPLAHAMVPGVDRVVESWSPDLMVVDQQALAGSIVARQRGIRWMTSCTTSASIVEPLETFPAIAAWQDELLASVQREHGLVVWRRPGLSPDGVLVFSSELLAGGPREGVEFVGPVATGRPEVPFPWDELQGRRRVLVSLGTVSFLRGASFYKAVVEGLGGTDLQVILVAPESLVPDPPGNILRCDYVPQVQLLSHVDAVVSHGGHNTVVESLSAGKPLVLAPIRDDQPIVANQVVAAGAGLRVKFGRVRPQVLHDAVFRVLDNDDYSLAAERIGRSLRTAGGASRAVELIEALLEREGGSA